MRGKSTKFTGVISEPDVLKTIGMESKRNGTDRLTRQQIARIINKARAQTRSGRKPPRKRSCA